MDSQTLIAAAVTVGVGALSGGITNAVAVWMLFHPHDPARIGPFTVHGAIPKNKARLARSVGKVVGERLLTPADLSQRLIDPTLRAAFDRTIGGAVQEMLEREHGPLANALGAEARSAIESALPSLAERIADRAGDHFVSPTFVEQVGRLLGKLSVQLGHTPIGASLNPDERQALKLRVERWAAEVAGGEELATALRRVIAAELERLAADERPLAERLPAGLISAVEQAIADSLPGIIERVGDALARPEARGEVLQVLRGGINHALQDLMLHQRFLAKLVVTDDALTRLLDSFANAGADRLATDLRGGPLQVQVRRAVGDAVQTSLRVPLGERLSRLGPERRAALAAGLTELLVHTLRSQATRTVLSHALDRFLEEADRRTWGDLLGALPAPQVARILGESLASVEGRRWIADTVLQLARSLLGRPLGRPAQWLGPATSAAITRGASDAAWGWVNEQVPILIERLSVQEMVEQKVLGFSTQRMEEIVRNVTQRELDLIVNLGYWLGGIVGLVAFGVGLLLR